jgi:glycosyltransferase involved in cell wall biosynthesis
MSNDSLSEPWVSICCCTYNHGNFIRQCLDGFVMQKTTFPFEILVHEDASVDNTASIVKEYEANYPHLFRCVYQSENQFQKQNTLHNILIPMSRGRYIAICEGDDYWTDPYKLQKQVDFLETNEEYSLCVGGYIKKNETTCNTQIILKNGFCNDPNNKGITFTLSEMKNDWITKTLTILFKKSDLDKINLAFYKHATDTHLIYHLLKNKKAFYFNEIFGIFRVHRGGINSMQPEKYRTSMAYICYKELYEHNGDDFTRYMYRKKTLGLLNYNLYNRSQEKEIKRSIKLYLKAVKLTKNIREIFPLFIVIVPRKTINLFKKYLGYPLGDG